jgi:uncharacterized protein (TIGR04551 family)
MYRTPRFRASARAALGVALSVSLALVLLDSHAAAQPAQPAPPVAPPPPAAKPAPKPAPAPAAAPKPAAPKPAPAAPAPAAPPAKPGAPPPKPGVAPKPGAAPAPAEPPVDEPAPDAEPEGEPEEAESEVPGPPPPPQPGTRPAAPSAGGFSPMPMLPQPGSDSAALEKQGDQRPSAAEGKRPAGDQVFAEDWWSHARPIFEIHGYFRVRAELFHNFSLGRIDSPDQALWPMPADNRYTRINDQSFGPELCTADETVEGIGDSDNPADGLFPCKNKTQAGANLRFRLNPELHISDNLRIVSQIDMLDNLVLGSTPEGYGNQPGESDSGYTVRRRSGYTPLGFFDGTQVPPSSGENSLKDSIRIKRAWAEYMTPVGELRFGRMPDHWGLGMLHNAGDGFDDDYQSTVDRIMFITGIKSLDLYVAGAWDFANEGPTSETFANPQAQAYDLGQLDDVDQYVLMLMRRKNEELTKLSLAQGKLVLNGGLYLTYRRQTLGADVGPDTLTALNPGTCSNAFAIGCFPSGTQDARYQRRGAEAWIPDLWLQLLYKKFRFEVEAVAIRGSVESIDGDPVEIGGRDYVDAPGGAGWKLRQYGVATELEQKLVEDRLKLQFKFGWASGDGDQVARANQGATGLVPGFDGFLAGDETLSTFRFHPNYKVDLILNRNLLTRIQGVYYFRPGVDYDFVRSTNGQRFGGGFNAIWTRASQFIQTPGHKRDLGVELNFSLYFQSKDGVLNDDPDRMGGFFTMLQYGVLFPMGALDYQPGEKQQIEQNFASTGAGETSSAQILRWYLGVMF